MVCVEPNDIPCCSIVDAELMYSLPKETTAATGLNGIEN
jgi:lactaldehyde reductase